MTHVYSGGLVYEYANEVSNYGLVGSDGNELPDFGALKSALAATPAPTGDGGYQTGNKPSSCPPASDTWLWGNDTLPAMPDGAKKFLTQGAGTGPGLTGPGSQDASSGMSTATASAGSGSATVSAMTAASTAMATGSSNSTGGAKSAAQALRAPSMGVGPMVCAGVLVLSTMLGAALL